MKRQLFQGLNVVTQIYLYGYFTTSSSSTTNSCMQPFQKVLTVVIDNMQLTDKYVCGMR